MWQFYRLGDSSKRVGKGLSAKCLDANECRFQGWQEANWRSALGKLGHWPQWQHGKKNRLRLRKGRRAGRKGLSNHCPSYCSIVQMMQAVKEQGRGKLWLSFTLWPSLQPLHSPLSTHPSHAADVQEGRSFLCKPSRCCEPCEPGDDLVAEYVPSTLKAQGSHALESHAQKVQDSKHYIIGCVCNPSI